MDLVLMTKSVEINSNRFLIFYIDREIIFSRSPNSLCLFLSHLNI
jgi:hypothetical protein